MLRSKMDVFFQRLKLLTNFDKGKTCSYSLAASKYDSIGFNLDHTLALYRQTPLFLMSYNVMSKFLVEEKGYSSKHLYRSVKREDFDFLQRGLFLDFHKGNILKVGGSGVILESSHGTKKMSQENVEWEYGKERSLPLFKEHRRDLTFMVRSPFSNRMKVVLDFFAFPALLCFARLIDTMDELIVNNKGIESYNVGPDILEGCERMYARERFSKKSSEFFENLKVAPHKYYRKCDSKLIEWLKKLKEDKFVYLITGSNIDFADYTASYCLGQSWRDLFDFIVCYAGKPVFYHKGKEFRKIEGIKELEKTYGFQELCNSSVWSEGSWDKMKALIATKMGVLETNSLYVGDNLIQDVYSPNKFANLDTVAMIEELEAEYWSHPHRNCIASHRWGPYLKAKDSDQVTLWGNVIKNHTIFCVRNILDLAQVDFDYDLEPHVPIRPSLPDYPVWLKFMYSDASGDHI